MRRYLVLVPLMCLLGCGGERPVYTTIEKEMQRTAGSHESSSVGFARRAENQPALYSPQEHDAPFMPGYNARGETAPLRAIKDVVENIQDDWAEVEDVVATHPVDSVDPYDYEGLAEAASRLVMRAGELRTARRFELARAGVTPDMYKPDEVDHDIDLFEVNARRLRSAAAKRQPEVIDEVLMKMPGAVPRFLGESAAR